MATESLRIAVVSSRYNEFVCQGLREGALATLEEQGIARTNVAVHEVPGAYELPLAAQLVAERGDVDAIICLGCVIRGETPHFDFISAAVAQGVMTAMLTTRVPTAFGVLTTDSAEQAVERARPGAANKGREAALAALALARLRQELAGPLRERG